ncbi:MAG: pseudouridine synthase [Methanoregulaceae archaeon]|nr:pseudouridine synthase [Methanoregulaceae archaeon]MCU0629325.1 pseudouridine synthase [Methanoregulaceae archaeon]
MSTSCLQDSARTRVQVIADYQFGKGAGQALFPEGCEVILSRTGRVRQISLGGKRLATVRAQDGRFTLGIDGALRLLSALPPPAYRVVVTEEVAEFIMQGKNTFAKHVIATDPAIRAGDEVMVVNSKDDLLATGSAVLSGGEMLLFNYGVAVKVRQGR